MRIWVDADACPRAIKEILFRAANRVCTPLVLVANRSISVPPSPYIRTVRVSGGFDEADQQIAGKVQPGELVVTADIPLAAAVVAKGAHALNPRGEFYTKETVGERLSLRDFMEELRSSGIDTGGPGAFSKRDCQKFANQLDIFLAKQG